MICIYLKLDLLSNKDLHVHALQHIRFLYMAGLFSATLHNYDSGSFNTDITMLNMVSNRCANTMWLSANTCTLY